ncbi:MAG TPA: hypothetical protein PKG60_04650 [Spirochaetota bacterium]|nr:hypothetical protein [Spirochaetota bacterium]HPS87678.1 hypothetical protein [Spirochaetota bacterium]
MENCIICNSQDFKSKVLSAITHFDYSCSNCGKFRVDDLLEKWIRSDSITQTEKDKLSLFLHSMKINYKMVIIFENKSNTDCLEEAIEKGEVLEVFIDDILN